MIIDYTDKPGWRDGALAGALDVIAGAPRDPLRWILDGNLPPECHDYFVLAYNEQWEPARWRGRE